MVTVLQSLIPGEEWTVVRKILLLSGEIVFSISFKCSQNMNYDYELRKLF